MNRKPFIAPAHLDALRRFKAGMFQVLGNPTRIHIIETLRERELSVGEIVEQVKGESANISQHLAILRSKRLVNHRKVKNQVLYSLRNPLLFEVLDIMRHFCQTNLNQAIQMMGEMNREGQD